MKSFDRILDTVTFGSVTAIGFLVVPAAYDPFAVPKLLLLHAAGILLIGLFAAGMILGAIDVRELFRRTPARLLVAAILCWTAITGLTAEHHRSALFGFLTAASAAALFLATMRAARRHPIWILLAVIVPTAANATMAILQQQQIWTMSGGIVGLMGNPNYLGSYLVAGVLAASAWFLAARSATHRVVAGAFAVLILAGVAVSQTRGAVLGVAAGLAALIVTRFRKRGLVVVMAMAVIALIGAAAFTPFFTTLRETPLEILTSGRIIAFAAAARMFADSPLLGVGPGCFEYAYFDYASLVYPSMTRYAIAGRQSMFGEAHNDHLQIAAETGAVGYLLFAASLVLVAAVSRPRIAKAETVRVRFARLCGLPLAAGLAALALFQFPLYLAGSLSAFVCTAGLIIGWTDDEALAG